MPCCLSKLFFNWNIPRSYLYIVSISIVSLISTADRALALDARLLLHSPASLSACLPACLVDCFNRLAFPLSVSLQQFGTGYRLRLQRRWLRLPRLPRLLLLLLGKTQISSMSCGLGAGAGSVDWAAVLLQNRYNFVVIYSDASFQHVLQRLLHSYIKLHTHTHKQAQIDTILQAHVLHRFVRYAIVIAPRRVAFGSVLFLLVRFSVQFNFFLYFSISSSLPKSSGLLLLFLHSVPWRGLRTIEANRFFFWFFNICCFWQLMLVEAIQ